MRAARVATAASPGWTRLASRASSTTSTRSAAARRSRPAAREPTERIRLFEHHPPPQRDPGRHLRVRPARLRVLAAPAARSSGAGSSRSGPAREAALRRRRRGAVAHARGHRGRERVAPGGLYQHAFDRSDQVNLVRVLLPSTAGLFPEISAGQHRFTVRFVRWRGVDARPVQVTQDVRFRSRSAEGLQAQKAARRRDDRPVGRGQHPSKRSSADGHPASSWPSRDCGSPR